MKKLLLLSGKGGTGKTTTAAAFLTFSQAHAMADCDVDAPNLHLALPPAGEPETSVFIGSDCAQAAPELCTGCGLCAEHCRFGAIGITGGHAVVSELFCEGCGVCAYICPEHAITLVPDESGTKTLYRGERTFSTAELKMGRGNSGKLVTEVKKALFRAAGAEPFCIIDGSPGIGCPVMASLSGVDLALLVTEPSLSGLSDLERLVHTAAVFQVQTAVLVNKADLSPAHTEAVDAFCREQGVPCIGHIPYDPQAARAAREQKSIAAIDCPARDALWQAYRKITALLGLPEPTLPPSVC